MCQVNAFYGNRHKEHVTLLHRPEPRPAERGANKHNQRSELQFKHLNFHCTRLLSLPDSSSCRTHFGVDLHHTAAVSTIRLSHLKVLCWTCDCGHRLSAASKAIISLHKEMDTVNNTRACRGFKPQSADVPHTITPTGA